jgi:hypothetical protein
MVLAQKQIRRPVEQNRRPRYVSPSYAHLIFDKGTRNIMEKKTASSTNVAEKIGHISYRKLKLDSCLSPCTSINSK